MRGCGRSRSRTTPGWSASSAATTFGRVLVLATPLAQAFIGAPDDRQELLVAHVNAAARECAGGEDEIRFPMTTNVAVALAP
jgi:hypothetical protein